MSFVMKITNFVKSAKTSFLAPLTQNARECFAPRSGRQSPNSTTAPTGLVPHWKRWAIISSRCWATVRTGRSWELRAHIDETCSYWFRAHIETFIVTESPLFIWSSGTDVLRQANANCHFCLSAKCFKIVIFLGFAITHYLKQFRFESSSFWYPEFI